MSSGNAHKILAKQRRSFPMKRLSRLAALLLTLALLLSLVSIAHA